MRAEFAPPALRKCWTKIDGSAHGSLQAPSPGLAARGEGEHLTPTQGSSSLPACSGAFWCPVLLPLQVLIISL